MDFKELSEKYGAFYAPAFAVKVSGKNLVREMAIGVSQVEVDLSLGAAGRFSFPVVDAYDNKRQAFVSGEGVSVLDVLTFGATVEIGIGYGSQKALETLISGVITEITTNFSEGGTPELSVAGYDHSFPMTLGKRSRSWAKATDSEIVRKLAKEHSLDIDVEETPTGKLEQTEQNQESDFEFLKKLAERNHYEFYVDARKVLRFGKPRDKEGAVVALKWGESLLSFKPEANLAAQVSQVEVYGWDRDNKKPIVGIAVAGEESGHDPRRESGGERLRGALRTGKNVVLQLRQPVFTEVEAKRRAQAVLNDHAKKFLTGEAECIGVPELRPDRNVDLVNLGEAFSKTYYIQQTVHKLDGSGYRTRIKVKETVL
jgi:phage protein D